MRVDGERVPAALVEKSPFKELSRVNNDKDVTVKKRFMTSEMGPKSIRDVLCKLEGEIADGIAAAMEIDVSGTPKEVRERVVAVLNDDAAALARLLLKIDSEIFELVREVVEKGNADIGIMDLFEHPVSADLVSFLVKFFPEDTKRDGTDIHYFMPTDEGFCGNIHRLFADADFLTRRKRANGVRRFLKAVATFYGAVGRIDLNKVLCVIGRDVANEFELGEPVTASECFDFAQNWVVRHDFQLCLRNPPNGLGEYLMPVSAPENDEEERSLDGLLSSILEDRHGKPMKLPTVDELLQLTNGNEYDFIETDEGEDLLDFLIDELGHDGEWGVDFLGYVALRVRIGADVEAVLKGLAKEFGFTMPTKKKLADEFLALFCNYFNSVPTWGNYGAAPAEMRKRLGVSGNVELKAFSLPRNPESPGDDDEEDCEDEEFSGLPWDRC